METQTVFMDWKTQHTDNFNSPNFVFADLMQFQLKSHPDIFVNIDKSILEFIWIGKGTRIAKTILKEK